MCNRAGHGGVQARDPLHPREGATARIAAVQAAARGPAQNGGGPELGKPCSVIRNDEDEASDIVEQLTEHAANLRELMNVATRDGPRL